MENGKLEKFFLVRVPFRNKATELFLARVPKQTSGTFFLYFRNEPLQRIVLERKIHELFSGRLFGFWALTKYVDNDNINNINAFRLSSVVDLSTRRFQMLRSVFKGTPAFSIVDSRVIGCHANGLRHLTTRGSNSIRVSREKKTFGRKFRPVSLYILH